MGSLSAWLSVLETSVLIGTLVVLIVQLRQFTRTMRHDAVLRAVETHDQLAEVLVADPDLNKYFYNHDPDLGNLAPDELRYYNFVAIAFTHLERLYLMHSIGWMDDKLWSAWERWMIATWFPSPIFQQFWSKEAQFHHEEFHHYIDRMLSAWKPNT